MSASLNRADRRPGSSADAVQQWTDVTSPCRAESQRRRDISLTEITEIGKMLDHDRLRIHDVALGPGHDEVVTSAGRLCRAHPIDRPVAGDGPHPPQGGAAVGLVTPRVAPGLQKDLLRDLLGLRAVLAVDDRAALAGIVFVLKTGISWRELLWELFGWSGVTCWRRLRDWTEAGVFDAVHRLLLDQLRALDRLDLDVAEPARQHSAHPVGRRDPGDPRQSRPASPTPCWLYGELSTLNIIASPCGTKASRRGSLEGTPTMAPAWARPDGSSNAHLPLTPACAPRRFCDVIAIFS